MTWTRPRRRLALAGGASVVVVLVLVLALQLGDDGDDNPPAPTSTSSGPLPKSVPTVKLPAAARLVEGDVAGAHVRLEVQPLVRSGSLTVLTAVLTVLEVSRDGSLTVADAFTARGETSRHYTLSDVRLFAPDQSLLASPTTSADGEAATSSLDGAEGLKKGGSAGLRVVFGALPPETRTADILWPLLGVLPDVPVRDGAVPELPPFGASRARDVSLVGVTGAARPVTIRSSELAGALRTEQAPTETKVVLASDVLFALDRADLSPAANAALDRAAAEIGAAGPGPVKVTGHTDDQGTAEYNLDLSNRRAQAVAAALAQRLPPSTYPLEVSGRGESEPAVKGTTPEARAANRRVELLVERRLAAAPRPADAALPPGGGPTAKAADGLVFDQSDGSQLRLKADRAVRQGTWLRVDLIGSIERNDKDGRTDFLVDLRDATRHTVHADASGIGVLDGSVLRLPAVDPAGTCACANTLFGMSILGLEQRKFSIWVAAPAQAAAPVVVQLPLAQGRLLDVPVMPR